MTEINVPIFIRRLDDKIDNNPEHLLSLIETPDKDNIKKSEQQHYATKYYVLGLGWIFMAIICIAYCFITPRIIRSKTSQLETKFDEALGALKSKHDVQLLKQQ